MVAKLGKFFRESYDELRQVHWPARREALYLTFIVIVFTAILAAFLGGFDYVFTYAVRLIAA